MGSAAGFNHVGGFSAIHRWFFEGSNGDKIATGGFVGEWGEAETRKIADEITLVP